MGKKKKKVIEKVDKEIEETAVEKEVKEEIKEEVQPKPKKKDWKDENTTKKVKKGVFIWNGVAYTQGKKITLPVREYQKYKDQLVCPEAIIPCPDEKKGKGDCGCD